MDYLETLEKAVIYIEDHLEEDIKVEEVHGKWDILIIT